MKCKNGKLHRPVDDVHVVFRVDLDPEGADASAIAHSYDADFGSQFIEQIACRELYGRFWDHEKEGSPCFDPVEDGEPPEGRFMMWDVPPDDGDEHLPSLTIYGPGPKHTAERRYKIAKTQLTIQDLMSIETDGDRFFTR